MRNKSSVFDYYIDLGVICTENSEGNSDSVLIKHSFIRQQKDSKSAIVLVYIKCYGKGRHLY